MQDATLAIQNMMNAAESMGLGAVLLGSINNQPKELIKVLDLPKMTYPVLGIQVGIPDQEPQLKPRLPLDKIVFENEYPKDFQLSDLKEYDEVVQTTMIYEMRTKELIPLPIKSPVANCKKALSAAMTSWKSYTAKDYVGGKRM